MTARARASSSSSPWLAGRLGAVVTLALAAATARAAEAQLDPSLQDNLWGELSVALAVASRDDSSSGEQSAQGLGIQARFGGSLYSLATGMRRPGPGFRIRDAWTAGLGTGLQRGYTASSLGFTFRLEATLRPVYQVSDELDVFARVGYMVGYDRIRAHPGCFSGNDCVGYDAWIVTGGARAGKLFAEAGLGWSATGQSGGYGMATVQYRLRPTALFSYVGLHYEGTAAGHAGDVSLHTVRLVVGSH